MGFRGMASFVCHCDSQYIDAIVIYFLRNIKRTGTAVLNGQEWTARAYEDGKVYPAGTIVKVKEIRGVTLYVTESDAMPEKHTEQRII